MNGQITWVKKMIIVTLEGLVDQKSFIYLSEYLLFLWKSGNKIFGSRKLLENHLLLEK